MKIAFLTGPCPPGECGVGDYVVLLAEALNEIDVRTEIVTVHDWTIVEAIRVHRKLKEFDVVQIHYPSLGIGTKLGPQLNALLRRSVIVLHEGSQVHILRQLALYPFSVFPKHVVFFSEFERRFGIRWAPWISSITSVIPPPSNIRECEYHGPRDLNEIVAFGLIRPGRGHEQVVQLAELIKLSNAPFRIRVIGTPQSSEFVSYFDGLRANSANLPIVWDSGLSEQQVAERLTRAAIAYLPYPDGAAELRSTLKAALLHKLAIVTTQGRHTPHNLADVVCFAQTPAEALIAIRRIQENPQLQEALSRKAAAYVKDWTWDASARSYARLYEHCLQPGRATTATQIHNA